MSSLEDMTSLLLKERQLFNESYATTIDGSFIGEVNIAATRQRIIGLVNETTNDIVDSYIVLNNAFNELAENALIAMNRAGEELDYRRKIINTPNNILKVELELNGNIFYGNYSIFVNPTNAVLALAVTYSPMPVSDKNAYPMIAVIAKYASVQLGAKIKKLSDL